jgi:hypothetical protein
MTEVTEYTECQSFSPVVRIGSPSPASACCLPPPLWFQVGDTLACGNGAGGANLAMRQTLWYSRYSIIPLQPELCPPVCEQLIKDDLFPSLCRRWRSSMDI